MPATRIATSRLSMRAVIALAATAALLVSACSGDDGDSASETSTSAAAAADETTTTGVSQETTTTTVVAEVADESSVRVVRYDTPAAPGGPEWDHVDVLEHGPVDARNVFVFVPGTSLGASYFSPVALGIANELEDWQVWSVDRRENLLEDHSVLERLFAGDATDDEVFDYYLRWLTDDTIADHFAPPADDDVAFAREWGMSVAIEDLAVVIDAAKDLGGEVVLGGHSLGGNITVGYATWDFDGRAGFEDLSGIALIDGGSASGSPPTVEEIQAELDELALGSPFNDLVGLGLPWAAGVFIALGSSAALLDPEAPNIAYEWPVLPENVKPPVAPTNAAQYGYALDRDTSGSLAILHLSLGQLAAEGDPRGWVDDGLVPVARAAAMFAGDGAVDGAAWYHPRRLSIDSGTTNGGIANPAQELVGVRAIHGDAIQIPIFAIETGFGSGRVLAGARSLAEASGLPDSNLTLVEAHDLTHTDPMAVPDVDNPLLAEIVPFLSEIA